MLPSVVGVDAQGQRIVGQAARNQYVVAPERTVRSVKRRMGRPERDLALGADRYTPEEISAFILQRLIEAATAGLGHKVDRAVITIPAYFADRQRQATLRAGELAGLRVERLLHEPTAAALVYGLNRSGVQTALVYDLGGGTFDASVVEMGDGITEVRATHGDRELGGDDFDARIVDHLAETFQQAHRVDLRQDRVAMARLWRAAEAAKIHLSNHAYVQIREEFIASHGGKALHLETELTRQDFEAMIRPLLDGTLDAVRRALRDASVDPRVLDEVLLVGGSSRIPLVRELVAEELGREPRQDLDPDCAVALGAAVQAAMIEGRDVDAVLVDVCPHSLGVRVLDTAGIVPDDDVFVPLIHRNSAIPVSRSEFFYTSHPEQDTVRVRVYQGEDRQASRNIELGHVLFRGLSPSETGGPREVLVAFDYDVNGILHVAAVDRRSDRREEATLQALAGGAPESEFAVAGTTDLLDQLERLLLTIDGRTSAGRQVRLLISRGEELAASGDAEARTLWEHEAAAALFAYGVDEP